MERSQRWNTLQICPRRDSNSGGSELWSNAPPARPRRRPETHIWIVREITNFSVVLLIGKWWLAKGGSYDWKLGRICTNNDNIRYDIIIILLNTGFLSDQISVLDNVYICLEVSSCIPRDVETVEYSHSEGLSDIIIYWFKQWYVENWLYWPLLEILGV